MNTHSTAFRLAFSKATEDVPVHHRTRLYAMVRSAMNRRLGTRRPKTGWSVARSGKR